MSHKNFRAIMPTAACRQAGENFYDEFYLQVKQ